MKANRCPDRAVSQDLPVGPLHLYVAGFRESLAEQGYSSDALYEKTRLVADLDQWLVRHRIGIENLDETQAQKLLHSRRTQGRDRRGDPATLRAFLRHLREAKVLPDPSAESNDSALHRVEASFAQYLTDERGLAQATLYNYLSETRRFLSKRFGTGAIWLGELSPQDITRHVLDRARAVSTRRAQLVTTALRSFLRFLYQRGSIPTNLAASVPTVARWSFAALPKYLPPEQIERLLHSCKQDRTAGRRDHAILLLLARLGLRAGEVVHMSLDDIDWEAGDLIVRGKGSRRDRLPIPTDVGGALAAYLQHERPRCSSRRVFIRRRAPRQGFSGSAAVDDVLRRALKRAGLNPSFQGAHLLRHSLATRMLRGGASLAEIGKVLRHQLPSTTEIYAKVDLAALHALAQPWPGGEA